MSLFTWFGSNLWRPEHCEQETLSNGTVLMCRRPHIAPDAWLHSLFPPLRAPLPQGLEIPEPIVRLWCERGNGFRIFDRGLSLFGVRQSHERTRDSVHSQPYSFEHGNSMERPQDTPDDAFAIGAYARTGHLVYLNSSGGIEVVPRDDYKVIFRFDGIDQFIFGEVKRFSDIYARNDKPSKEEVLPWA